jgi:hypothetical protein
MKRCLALILWIVSGACLILYVEIERISKTSLPLLIFQIEVGGLLLFSFVGGLILYIKSSRKGLVLQTISLNLERYLVPKKITEKFIHNPTLLYVVNKLYTNDTVLLTGTIGMGALVGIVIKPYILQSFIQG